MEKVIYELRSDKFKTKTVNVFFCDELNREMASYNSLLVSVLKRGTNNYPTFRDIAIRGQELYDTKVYTDADKKGEIQVLSFAVTVVDEKYLKDSQGIFNEAVDLLFDIITNPFLEDGVFKSEYVEQEKVNLCDLIDSKINDKGYYATYRCFEEMCGGERYSIDEIGDKEIIKSIDNKKLYEYYKNVFLKKIPVKIFITGNIDEDNIEYTESKFRQIERQADDNKLNTGDILSVSGDMKNITERLNVVQSKVCIGFRTQTCASCEDYYAISVCNLIFGGGTQSKLFQNVREKESMAYYVYSRIDKFKGIMIVSGGIEENNKDRVLELVFRQLEDIKEGKISDAEFDAAINSYIDAVKQMQDGQRTLSEFYLGQMLCDVDKDIEQSIAEVKKVTKEDVSRAAKKIQADTIYFLAPEED